MEDKSPLTKFREIRGYTLEDFGQMLSPPVDKSTVMRWERGKVPVTRAPDVIAATGITMEQLRPDLAGFFKAKSPKRKRAERQTEDAQ
jgi:hypothetical protein